MSSDALPTKGEVFDLQYAPPIEGDVYDVQYAPSVEGDVYDLQYAPSPEDRRISARSILRVQARVLVDGEAIEVDTVDLSPHGVAVTSTRPLNIDQECSVELGISVATLAAPPQLRASVRYCARLAEDRFRIGMKFTAVSIEAAELIVDALEL